MPIQISILGCTGSIGRSALDVVRSNPDHFKVVALAAHSNIDLLKKQIQEFKPEYVAVGDQEAAKHINGRSDLDVTVWSGESGIERLASIEVDVALCAIVGAAGLKPMLKVVESSKRIAIANKEALVMAGGIVMDRARERGVEVLPVDSEHSAIFQCLHGHKIDEVKAIHITASGGPFYGLPREELAKVLPEQATKHPTWDMGAKISVDSATLMNKGLEVIEATWLFDLPLETFQVIIHPQSIVHSLVEFDDGNILAHLGVTDMRFPIQLALTWPKRVKSSFGRLDLTKLRKLTFAAPDFTEFPCLKYALQAAESGGTAPAILNAANEEAVDAFCQHRIGFLNISEVVAQVMEKCNATGNVDLDEILNADYEARRSSEEIIQKLGV